ncbi:serine hydrolase domain-containing protein [Natronincola peptidivorans]|nr:serine hydrolase domain-containing protein [Natronincola peptidivorans]
MRKVEKLIDEDIKKIMFYQDIPGLSLMITDDKSILYSKGYGVASIATKLPITENTIFHMASITKLFVATGIMQLVEKGKIELNKTVSSYISDLQLRDNRFNKITVLQMLSHTSGLPDCQDYGWHHPEYDEEALKRYVEGLKNISLLWEPGVRFHYSNIAYEVLGYLIEIVTGMTFEAYIDERILRPLGMKHSTLLYRENTDDIAIPHIKNTEKKVVLSNVYPYNRSHAPSSTLTSNVLDMSKWAIGSLNLGILKNERILQEISYKKMWDPVIDINNNQEKIGLGWLIGKHREYDILGHEGSDIGFRTSFAIIPEKKLSVGVFANLDNVSTRKIMRRVFDFLLGIEPKKL